MSNKTQTEQPEKTASAPRTLLNNKYGILLVFLGFFLLIATITTSRIRTEGCRLSVQMQGVGKECIKLEVVADRSSLLRGLSGRHNMPDNKGMLFVFRNPGIRCFWMKDMKFPLDIIWADANKKIVTIEENVQPNTYPNSFCPDQEAQFVIEVNAGVAQRSGLIEGHQLQF